MPIQRVRYFPWSLMGKRNRRARLQRGWDQGQGNFPRAIPTGLSTGAMVRAILNGSPVQRNQLKPSIIKEFLSIPADVWRSLKRFQAAMGVAGWRALFIFCLILASLLAVVFMLTMGYDHSAPSFMQFRICSSMSTSQTLTITLIGVMVPLFALVAIGEIIAVVEESQRYGRANAREKRWMIGSVSTLTLLCLVGGVLLYAWC